MNSTDILCAVQPYGGLPEDFTMDLFNDKQLPMSPPQEDFGSYTYFLQSQPTGPQMMMPLWEPWYNYPTQQQEAIFPSSSFPIAPMSPPLSISADETMLVKEESVSVSSSPVPRKRQPSQGVYRCPKCEKHFTRPYNLKSHMRTHTNEKPYHCTAPDCSWKFARPHDLKRHQLLHSGVKPHRCSHCDRKFARRDALRRHWKVDTECGEAVERAGATAPERCGRGRRCQ